jgi:hypothetical protein
MTILEFTSCQISIDEDSYCYSLSAEVLNLADWEQCDIGALIQVEVNTIVYEFLIDERGRDRVFNSTTYSISGRSKTSILGEGNFNSITYNYTNISAHDLIADLLDANGISYTFGTMIDWIIPSLEVSEQTPISIIQDIVEACGGIIICSPLGALTFNTKFSMDPLTYSVADVSFNDISTIFSVQETKEITPGWNNVTVSNIEISSKQTYNIEEVEYFGAVGVKKIRVTVFPFVNSINLLTSYISPEVSIVPEANPIVETITKELVEIVEGKGSVSHPIKDILSYSYGNTDLGPLTSDGTTVMTSIVEQSLLYIDYTTEYHEFLVSDALDNKDVQVYLIE